MMAEFGFPALFLFLGLLVAVMRSGVHHRKSRVARASVAAFAGVMFAMIFEAIIPVIPLLFLPMALLLGIASELDPSAISTASLPSRVSAAT
jgi:hypothetical protein